MSLQFYQREHLKKHTHWRWGEEKLGEVTQIVESWDALETATAKYVILGIPEDVGVRANYGKPGAAKAWVAFLEAFCNIQNNKFTNAAQILILGEIDVNEEMQDAKQLEIDDPFYPTKIGSLVKQIDDKVSEVIQKIVSLNKIPIVIGGGHNNAYGNLKGVSTAINQPVNCVNLDAHSDFRAMEHRHSGNGFSYAFEDGFLKNYYMIGLHKNYTSQKVFDKLEEQKKHLRFSLFEDYLFTNKSNLTETFKEAQKHCTDTSFGLELDLDVIEQMGSSAMSPSGVSVSEARQYLHYFGKHKNCAYIHVCEGNPLRELFPAQVGKTISYLISDLLSS